MAGIQQLYRRLFGPPVMDHEVQDLALVIDGASKVQPLATNPAAHLVEMPAWRRHWFPSR